MFSSMKFRTSRQRPRLAACLPACATPTGNGGANDPAVLDALLAEKWAHIVTAHEPAVGAMWGQAVRHPALWSWALGRDAIRRTLRPFKPWFWKQRPA
jgi:hypothetical protein